MPEDRLTGESARSPRRLAVIPARSGSKRIPNKNIRDFAGRPLISYALDAAAESKIFDTIHVSTESDEISSVVSELGYPVDFMRPESLADDHTPLMPILRYVTEEYERRGKVFDQIVLLMATAPMLDADDLRGGAKSFESGGGTCPVISIAPYPVPIEWAYRRNPDGTLKPVQPGAYATRSQDLESAYFDTGGFIFFSRDHVLKSDGAGSDEWYNSYELSKHKAVDIDEPGDWALAEAIFRGMERKK